MSKHAIDGGPAFPAYAGADVHKSDDDPTKDDPRNKILGGGMTLRDWFAGQALAGFMVDLEPKNASYWMIDAATNCYAVADAMIAARNAKGGAV